MNPVPWLQMTNMISYQGLVRTFPNAVLSKLASLSSDTIQATRQRLQDAVEGNGEVSPADVKELLLATKHLMLAPDCGE